MYISNVKRSGRLSVEKSRVYQSSMADYVINSNGFIRNDFAVLQESNNQLQMALALQHMQELSNGDSNKGKTFEEIVAMVKPRWCQSPAELDRFEQYCIDHALEFYKKLKRETPEDVKEAVGAAVVSQERTTDSSVNQ